MKYIKILAIMIIALIGSFGLVSAATTDVGVIIYPPTGGPESVCLSYQTSDTLYQAIEDTLSAIEDNYDLQDEEINLMAGYDGSVSKVTSLTKDNTLKSNDETNQENRQVWTIFTNNANATSFNVLNTSINEYNFENSASINNGYVIVLKYSTFNGTNLTSATPTYVPYSTVCKKYLDLKNIEVSVNGKKSIGADEKGGNIRKVYPESKIKFSIDLENLYSDDTEMLIEDIDLLATWESIDDGDDFEEETSIEELKPGKDKTVYIEFETPLIVEEKDYDLVLTITGQDLNGREFKYDLDYVTEIKKERHDVRITNFSVEPNEFTCEKLLSFNYELLNLGNEDDEEDVEVNLVNTALGIDYSSTKTMSGDVSEDSNKFADSFSVMIPEDRVDGTYTLELQAKYYDKTITRKLNLIAGECVKPTPKPTTPVNQTDTSDSTVNTQTTTNTTDSTQTTTATDVSNKDELSKNDKGMPVWAIVLIVVGGIVLYVSILVVVIIALKQKTRPPVQKQPMQRRPPMQRPSQPVERRPPQVSQETSDRDDNDSFY